MDNFIVSARKYRPVTFDSVVGQSHITTTLKNAISSGQLAQAFLFTGPRGVGKTTTARLLAKAINCENIGPDSEPCNECKSCRNFGLNASFNIHELDAASNNSVDDIRNLIEQVRFPPQDGKYKVYIIDEVHMLSPAAFNAFLKTLEEPPSYAIFILATTEKHKILPTILSRCQIFDFNRIQSKDIAEHLAEIAEKENVEFEEEALELIAQKADGGLRDALSMFDLNVTFSNDRSLRYKDVLDNLHVLDYDYYLQMADSLNSGDISGVVLLLDEIISKGFDLHQFVVGLNEHFRNLLVCKKPETIHLFEISKNIKAKYIDQSKRFSDSFLMSALSVGSQLDINFKSAKNQRLHVEIGLLKLSQITAVLDLTSLPEKKNPDDAVNDTAEMTSTITQPDNTSLVQEPVPGLKRGKDGFKSIRSILNTKEETESKEDTAKDGEAKVEVEVNDELIKEKIATFFNHRPRANERLFLEIGYELEADKITYFLPNSYLIELFDELKSDFLAYLNKEIGSKQFVIETILKAEALVVKPRTVQEKFERMAESNPLLWELKDVLDLDLKY